MLRYRYAKQVVLFNPTTLSRLRSSFDTQTFRLGYYVHLICRACCQQLLHVNQGIVRGHIIIKTLIGEN